MNMSNGITYTAKGSYPSIEVTAPSKRYAQYLLQDFTASKGELSAITLYLYQMWILRESHPDFSHDLKEIAGVEMHHLDMLGQLITLLGGEPQYRTTSFNRYTAWSGNYVSYERSYKQILKNNIASEQYAYNKYLMQARTIKDKKVASILLRIAEDEKIHIGIFENYLLML